MITVNRIEQAHKDSHLSIDNTVTKFQTEVHKSGESETSDTSTMASNGTPGTGCPVNAESLVNAVLKSGIQIFRNQFETPFAFLSVKQGATNFECLEIGSRSFLQQLLTIAEQIFGVIPPRALLREATEILKIKTFSNMRRDLAVRFTEENGKLVIDLGDMSGDVVELNSDGWRKKPQDRPRFVRPSHLRSLPEPTEGGDWAELFEFLRLEEGQDHLLVLAWMLSAFHPGILSPILVVIGPQGSGKSTICRRIRSLIDPSQVDMLGDVDFKALFQTFQHHAVPCFENVSHFNRKTADMFCRAVTGNGVERRRLYTDCEQVLYSFRRAIMINGIEIPSIRPDFLDRCLIINCKRLDHYESLQRLDELFDQKRPQLLGAFLDLLSKAIKSLDIAPAPTEFRLADFAQFGRAVATAIGRPFDEFDAAYRSNLRQHIQEVFEDCFTFRAVREFAHAYSTDCPWKGSATELHEKLCRLSRKIELGGTKRDLPKTPRWLSTRLTELAPILQSEGVLVKKAPRTNHSRLWIISRVPAESTIDLGKFNSLLNGEQHNG
ncbi:MAG TPA: hypothetical protein VNQ76_07640 [Planctomicrobium sp.]|nr:hypothetical protein [Planctomicrobium sp.]